MIKNILYSLFVHFILLSLIYLAVFNKKKPEKIIEDIQEISLNIIDNNKTNLPINEEITKQPKNIEKIPQPNQIQENSPTSQPNKILKEPVLKIPEKPLIPKKEIEVPPTKIPQETIKKEEIVKKEEPKIIKKILAKSNINNSNSNSDSNNSHENLKIMNLKIIKNEDDQKIGLGMSTREMMNIQSQLKLCYKRSIEESGFSSNTKIILKITISKDGYIENDLDEMIDLDKYNNPDFKDYKIIIDNIRRSLDLCSPLRNLPTEKYDLWKEIILQFDMKKN